MKLVLTDATQFEVDSMTSGLLDTTNEKGLQTQLDDIEIYFSLEGVEDFITKKKEIQSKLTDINISGAYILKDDGKRINLGCTKLYSLVLRITDSECTLSGILI